MVNVESPHNCTIFWVVVTRSVTRVTRSVLASRSCNTNNYLRVYICPVHPRTHDRILLVISKYPSVTVCCSMIKTFYPLSMAFQISTGNISTLTINHWQGQSSPLLIALIETGWSSAPALDVLMNPGRIFCWMALSICNLRYNGPHSKIREVLPHKGISTGYIKIVNMCIVYWETLNKARFLSELVGTRALHGNSHGHPMGKELFHEKQSINLLNKAGKKYCIFKESIILTKLSTSIFHQLLLYTVYWPYFVRSEKSVHVGVMDRKLVSSFQKNTQ